MTTTTAAGKAAAVDPFATINRKSSATDSATAADETADRFLKLLVTQMQNQDPLNPMDNAQVTTQMAQINTVNGIEKLNRSMQSMGSQFGSLQALQSVSLVGRDVEVPGDRLAVNEDIGSGAVRLGGKADSVKVEVVGSDGRVVGTVDLGARAAGTHRFEFDAKGQADAQNLRFRVVATNPSAAGPMAVATESLMRDRVVAVRSGNDGVTLDLRRSGSVAYSGVQAFL
jgi:flagellar basal-body rod modification protein FlgD